MCRGEQWLQERNPRNNKFKTGEGKTHTTETEKKRAEGYETNKVWNHRSQEILVVQRAQRKLDQVKQRNPKTKN